MAEKHADSFKRRDFIKKGSLVASSLSLATIAGGCNKTKQAAKVGPYINFNNTYRWKMTTTWPPNFPVLGEGCQLFAKWVNEMSGGRMEVTVYGGGELVPPLELFDAVSNGAIELGHGASYYWAGKVPSAQFFATVPFGMNAQQTNDWLVRGGGLELWREAYDPHNMIPFVGGNTGMQMGGWFKNPIHSLEDIQGLKMRIPGIGGKVFTRAGGSAVLSAGGEIYTNLERGVIDATDWIGPYHDYLMGFYEVAKYYYYPGWHEPGTAMELVVNKEKYLELPSDLQAIIHTAAERLNQWTLAESEIKNSMYAQKLIDEEGVKFEKFPQQILQVFKQHTDEVLAEITTEDSMSKKVYTAYQQFQKQMNLYARYNERLYYTDLSQFHT